MLSNPSLEILRLSDVQRRLQHRRRLDDSGRILAKTIAGRKPLELGLFEGCKRGA
jgi:hypothetical protein